jgi:hypothetical protein
MKPKMSLCGQFGLTTFDIRLWQIMACISIKQRPQRNVNFEDSWPETTESSPGSGRSSPAAATIPSCATWCTDLSLKYIYRSHRPAPIQAAVGGAETHPSLKLID